VTDWQVVAALAWANALSQTNDDRPSDAIATSSFDVRDKRFPARFAAFPIRVVSIMFDLFRRKLKTSDDMRCAANCSAQRSKRVGRSDRSVLERM